MPFRLLFAIPQQLDLRLRRPPARPGSLDARSFDIHRLLDWAASTDGGQADERKESRNEEYSHRTIPAQD